MGTTRGRPKEPSIIARSKAASRKSHRSKEELDRREAEEMVVPLERLQPPAYLTDKQAKDFDEIARWIEDVNAINASRTGGALFATSDAESVAQYIVARDLSHFYLSRLSRASKTGNLYEEKAMARLHKQYCDQARAYATDLGLTLRGRLQVQLPPIVDPDGEFGGF